MKEKLAAVAQYWFWIATALVTLISVGVWWISSGKLITEFEAKASALDADASKITQVRGALGTHPNEVSHKAMQQFVDLRTKSVMEAWTSVFSRQQDILVWPVNELKQDFVDEFTNLIPIELKVKFPTPEEEEKLPALRQRYKNYIGAVLPKIAEIAKAKWTADFDAPSAAGGMGMGMGMGTGMPMGDMLGGGTGEDMYGGSGTGMPGMTGGAAGEKDDGTLVNWSSSSQQQLLSDLFPWRAKGSGAPPSTLEVLYSQENLWILRQLMQIIAIVNGDVGQRHQAKIREIDRIAIGKSVPKQAGMISPPGAGMAAGGMGGMMGSGMMGSGMMEGGGEGIDYGSGGMDMAAGMMDMAGGSGGMGMPGMEGGDGMGAEVATVDPGDNRYVDLTGAPLTAEQMRAALSSQSPTDAFMAVSKRVPVMLSLKMDQRNVPELLAVCGSVPLMVEVKHVRILPPGKASAAAGGGGMGMGMGMGMGSDMGMGTGMPGGDMAGGEDMYGGSGMMGGMGAAPTSTDPFPMDMTVEVYGIIYIYNPPSSESLGIEKVDETTVIDANGGSGPVADATTPEATPAADAANPADAAAPATTTPAADGTTPANGTAPAAEASNPAPAATPPAADPSGVPAATAPAGTTPATPPAEAGASWHPKTFERWLSPSAGPRDLGSSGREDFFGLTA